MKIVMVAGGDCLISEVKAFLDKTEEEYYVIGIDAGAALLTENGIIPDVCIGDFDTVDVSLFEGMNVIKLKPEKDEIDTEYALLYALDMHPSEIIIFGATGSRLDQTFASIELLRFAVEKGVNAYILNHTNRIRVSVGKTVLKKEDAFGKYVSILPYSETLKDLSMKGFKYDIQDFTLVKGVSRCISNEISADTAEITCSNLYILMETCD